MNLLKISWRNIIANPLNTTLSVILLAFGVGIISLLLLLEKQITEKFDRNIKDIDFVLGAKGSPVQLILANVYHVDAPTGNIKVEDAQKILKNPMVKDYIPLAYGDNYENYRIVGTNFKYPEHYGCQLAEGRLFSAPFEVTIGHKVAQEAKLKVGDSFTSVHGFDKEANEEDHHHATPFRVVGIFDRSDCAIDNLILTQVESVWMVHDHEEEHADEEEHVHDEAHDHEHSKEMTAYLIKKRNPLAAMMLANATRETNMQIADPAIEINRLSQGFGIGTDTMKAIAILIMILSFVSVFISLYNSLKQRRYELALMRSMGGTRRTLFTIILQEGLLLVSIGFLVGALLSRIGLLVLSSILKENFHYELNDLGISPSELVLLAVTLLTGIVASLLPAVRAVRMDISKTLSNG